MLGRRGIGLEEVINIADFYFHGFDTNPRSHFPFAFFTNKELNLSSRSVPLFMNLLALLVNLFLAERLHMLSCRFVI